MAARSFRPSAVAEELSGSDGFIGPGTDVLRVVEAKELAGGGVSRFYEACR